jgi:hypothetical protein
MPSSLPSDDSSRSLVPPTPESDITNSPHSPHTICDSSTMLATECQTVVAPQKRKAGRKPLYKTAQERRDRNRRAQLAFRARRSDYLARLEETCRSLEHVVVELQESNREANDALSRERTKVKHLERMLQSTSTFPNQQVPINFAMPIQPSDNIDMSCTGQQSVSVPPFTQLYSLITLEQQISPTTPIQPSMNPLLFGENYLGMPPLHLYRTLSPSLLL